MSVRPPIAVVGVSALFPGSPDARSFWRNIVEGADLLSEVPESHWHIDDYYDPDPTAPDKMYARRGGFLPYVDFAPGDFGIPPNVLPAIDTAQLLALAVARQVLEDVAGKDFSPLNRDRVSVVLGVASATEMVAHMAGRLQAPVWERALRSAGIPEGQLERFAHSVASHYTTWQADTFPGLLGNVVAGRIANRLDLGGTNCVVDAACASSLAALHIALNELYIGDSEMVITGGVDALNDILMFKCFAEVTALSPSGDCRPFSDKADGTMLGEGLAMVALKRLDDAERDGDHIYAVIRGLGTSSDGRAKSIYAPNPSGQAQALRRAYDGAGYGPDTVGLLEAHGTATKAGDAAEFGALREVFDESGREDRQWCAIGSVKSQVGHTKAAAGACGLFKVVMALHHKTLPPTIKVDQPNPALALDHSPFYLPTELKPWIAPEGIPRRASVSSFGFGGTNFHVTLEEYSGGGNRPKRHRSWKSELVILEGTTAASLAEQATHLAASLRDDDDMLVHLAQVTQTSYDAGSQHRLALVADDVAGLRALLNDAAGRIAAATGANSIASPQGYYYSAQESGAVALLFPGQGSQYVRMGADIPRAFDGALVPWETAMASVIGADVDLHHIAWPKTAFTSEERARQDETLTQTDWAQPAIGAHSLSLLRILNALGVQPVALGGHSFGEVIALCAAGVFDEEAALRVARKRGVLMAEAAASTAGTMCAVAAPYEIVHALLQSWRLPVVIANHNSPTQVIVSGPVDDITEAIGRLSDVGIQSTALHVATAFHSDIVAKAAEPFADFLDGIAFTEPATPVYANATAAPYDTDADVMRATLAGQLTEPVRFLELVRSMWAAGARTFVEVGPDSVLTNLVGKCLEGLPHNAVALDRRHTNGIRSLWLGLAQLVAAGVPMNLGALWADYHEVDDPRTRPEPTLVVKINGANYGKPQPKHLPRIASERDTRLTLHIPAAPESPVTAPAAPAVSAGASGDLVDDMLQVVAEKTGYPVEMLDLSMALEADLGIDSIKRVEILSAVQQRVPSLPEVEASAMAGLSTLQQIVDHLDTLLPGTVLPETVATNGNGQHHYAVPVPFIQPAPPPAVSAGGSGDLVDDMLQVVAEKTGYPVEMLDLSMALEADLGIDSIKRVEILSAVQQRVPSLPEVEASAMAGLSTLQQIVDHLDALLSDTVLATSPNGHRSNSNGAERGDRLPFDLTGVPVARRTVRAIAAPVQGTGIPGLSDSERVEIVGGPKVVADVLTAIFAEQGVNAVAVDEATREATCILHLGGLASAEGHNAVAVNRRVFADALTVAERMEQFGGVFVTVQDTGGTFGLLNDAGHRAWAGGLAALTKTIALEWPAVHAKAIDIDTTLHSAEQVAHLIADEILCGGAELEVGMGSSHGRVSVATCESHVEEHVVRLNRSDVIVVSGGARGVTAASTIALARATQASFVLIGRSACAEEPIAVRGLTTPAELKRALLDEARRQGEQLTPRQLEQRAQRVQAGREIRATMRAIEAAGSRVSYHELDIRDSAELAALLDRVRTHIGPITGLVHGAGVVADARLSRKTIEQFDRVFDTKVGGLWNLLDATTEDALKVMLLFSSAAARGGNVGQGDYAMANEVVNLVASTERVRRGPRCLVRALDWGPWEAGMVTPALKAVFESRGVEPISLDDGARAFVSEAFDRDTRDTQVVLGSGVSGGGLPHPLPEGGRSSRVVVQAAHQPYLNDHRVRQQVVLPVVQVGEWFVGLAEACRPGHRVQRLLDLRVLRGVLLPGFDDAGNFFTLRCAPVPGSSDRLQLSLLDADGVARYSAVAEMRSGRAESLPVITQRGKGEDSCHETFYGAGRLFHGPAFQVIERLAWCQPAGAVAQLHGLTKMDWPQRYWATDPAALDGCLQVGLLWSLEQTGCRMLPLHIGQVALYRSGPADGQLHCHLDNGKATANGSVFDLTLSDACGVVFAELLGVEMYPFTE